MIPEMRNPHSVWCQGWSKSGMGHSFNRRSQMVATPYVQGSLGARWCYLGASWHSWRPWSSGSISWAWRTNKAIWSLEEIEIHVAVNPYHWRDVMGYSWALFNACCFPHSNSCHHHVRTMSQHQQRHNKKGCLSAQMEQHVSTTTA